MSDEKVPPGRGEQPAGEEPETEPAEQLSPERGRRAKRLLRSRDDRMIAGVASGLGEYFAVDPVIFRIGFAVSVFLGGLGAFAYIALALFVPTGDAEGNVAERPPIERSRGVAIAAGGALVIIALSWGLFDGGFFWDDGWFFGPPFLLIALAVGLYFLLRSRAGESGGSSVLRIALAIVLALIACCALAAAAVASAWAGATGHGVAVGAVILAIGALLVLSAFRGGARWLLVPAAALAIPLGVVSAADISFGDGIGEREYRPASVASIPDEGYELGIGRLVVDLRELDWEHDTVAGIDVDLGIGEAVIAVPEDVCVAAELSSTAGYINLAGTESDGIDAELEALNVGGSPPLLEIEGEVDLGALRVVNDDEFDPDRHDGWRDHDDPGTNAERERAMEAACAPQPDRVGAADAIEPDPAAGGSPSDEKRGR